MKKRKKYNFIEKTYTKGGRLSFWLSLIAFCIMAFCILAAFTSSEGVGMTAGAMAVLSLLLAVYGFAIGLRSFADTEGSPVYSVLGAIFSGVTMVVWLTLFLAGLR